ncbi:MAG: hypothetical protein ABSG25_13280 [Bryobacteraceae bacterium]
MVGNSVLVATVIMLALSFWVSGECKFLIPYKPLLIHQYWAYITVYWLALFLNIFAMSYLFTRKLFLKETGQKLAHLEKQLRTDSSVSEELSGRIED